MKFFRKNLLKIQRIVNINVFGILMTFVEQTIPGCLTILKRLRVYSNSVQTLRKFRVLFWFEYQRDV